MAKPGNILLSPSTDEWIFKNCGFSNIYEYIPLLSNKNDLSIHTRMKVMIITLNDISQASEYTICFTYLKF